MFSQTVSQESIRPLTPMTEPNPVCPACDCEMRFIRPKGLCLIWVCRTCGHALIRRIEEPAENVYEDRDLLFLDELLG